MEEIVKKLIERKETISTMESCTGGYLANLITNVSGSSLVFMFGAVTYSNTWKIKLGVNKSLIDKYSVYSSYVASDMAKTIANNTSSTYGIGVTGKLGEADPNNPLGDNNKVYACIYNRVKDKCYDLTIPILSTDRRACKEMIAKEIENRFTSLL